MNNLIALHKLRTFDKSFSLDVSIQRPDRYRHIDSLSNLEPIIARGGGFSYTPASFGHGSKSIDMTKFNRIGVYDHANSTILLESGVKLIDLINWAAKHKLHLPVLPGHPYITIGGCIAADAHGKNPFVDGTFADYVEEILLFHPSYGYQNLSRINNPEIFSLTCGGYGLTGIIISTKLRLLKLPSYYVKTVSTGIASLYEAIDKLTTASGMSAYSWHDATKGSNFGKGLFFSSQWDDDKIPTEFTPYLYKLNSTIKDLPFSAWNKSSTSIVNYIYNRVNCGKTTSIEYIKSCFPLINNSFYYYFYGKLGVREYQLLIQDQFIIKFIDYFYDLQKNNNFPGVMISIKKFKGNQHSLSPSGTGYMISFGAYVNKDTLCVFSKLDEMMLAFKGQPYIVKDSRLPYEIAIKSIKNYDSFRNNLIKYDPLRLLRSELSDRLKI